MSFFERLKQKREEAGLSSKEMAELIGVAPSTYSQYENGHREPDVIKIKAIISILKISADYLLFGNDYPFEHQNSILSLYNQLDIEDKAEIRGMIKQMLKGNKYSDDKTISNDIIEELKKDTIIANINTK